MSIGDCITSIAACINNFLDENKLSHVFVPERRRETGPGKGIAVSTITAFHPAGFQTAVGIASSPKGRRRILTRSSPS